MKKFIVSLVTNRFGIVLATLNICYLANKSDVLGLSNLDLLGKIFIDVNMPNLIFTQILCEFSMNFLPTPSDSTGRMIIISSITFLIVFQWLFIAWL